MTSVCATELDNQLTRASDADDKLGIRPTTFQGITYSTQAESVEGHLGSKHSTEKRRECTSVANTHTRCLLRNAADGTPVVQTMWNHKHHWMYKQARNDETRRSPFRQNGDRRMASTRESRFVMERLRMPRKAANLFNGMIAETWNSFSAPNGRLGWVTRG